MRCPRLKLFSLLALLALTACAQQPVNGAPPPIRDDSRGDNDHADRGMRDSHTM